MSVLKKALIVGTAALFTVSAFAEYTSSRPNRRGNGHGNSYGNDYGNDYGRGGAASQQQFQSKFHGQQMRGQSSIALKQQIKSQNPGIDLKQYKLVSVKLVAKSKQGNGKAKLVVGQSESYSKMVQGSPYDFQSEQGFTYDKVQFSAPSSQDQGKWQVKLQGNFKIKRIVVNVKKKFAQQRTKQVQLSYYGEQFKGQSILALKQKLKYESNINLDQYSVQAVILTAKSKQGNGKATLASGQSQSYSQMVQGSPYNFQSEAQYTYSDMKFMVPAYGAQGKLQIKLQGNIKVKKVTVILKKKSNDYRFN